MMTKQVKKYDDMEEETENVEKNGPKIVKNISSCHLKKQEEESFLCDVCCKTYDTTTRRWRLCKKSPRTSTAAA